MNELEQAMRHPDVIKNQIKQNGGRETFVPYSPSNPPPYPVTSVNGQTGDVDIPTVNLPLSVQDGGTGATTAAQAAKNLGVLPLGEVATKIPSGADLNDYVSPGVHAIGSSSTAATIANIPSRNAGILRVFSSAGAAITASSTWKYLIQEYIVYTGERYQRYGESGSGTAVTWRAWATIYTSANFDTPVPVAQGGTGADNAADARESLGLGNVDNVRQYSAENPPIRYVDKSDISVSISSNGGYQSLGTFTSLGVPAGATVVSFFIKGWAGANGAPVLLASTDGKTLYCMMSDAPATVTLSVRVFYAL